MNRRGGDAIPARAADAFNNGFDWLAAIAMAASRRARCGRSRSSSWCMPGIAGAGRRGGSSRRRRGSFPAQDQGYLIAVVQIAAGLVAGTHRCGGSQKAIDHGAGHQGRRSSRSPFAGLDGASFSNAPNAGTLFIEMDSFARCAAKTARPVPRSWMTLRQRMGGDPRRQHPRHPAAAGARHRHRRRLQDDGAGPVGQRLSGAWKGRPSG